MLTGFFRIRISGLCCKQDSKIRILIRRSASGFLPLGSGLESDSKRHEFEHLWFSVAKLFLSQASHSTTNGKFFSIKAGAEKPASFSNAWEA